MLGGDEANVVLEAEWLRASGQISHLQSQLEEVRVFFTRHRGPYRRYGCSAQPTMPPQAANTGEDPDDFEAELSAERKKADAALLRLFQDALKTGRHQRANGLASNMHLQRSLEGARKLANLHK